MKAFIKNKIEEIKNLCISHKVEKLYVFGSVTTDAFNELSDIDFLISFSDQISVEGYMKSYFYLQYQLSKLFNPNIDLVSVNSLKNPYFKQRIEQRKQLIFAA